MRPLVRIAFGLTLAAGLQAALWGAMSGCSLDWSVPEPTEDAGGDVDAPDTIADHAVDPPADVAPEGGEDVAADVPFDGPMGDAVVPCVEQPTCADCVTCVLDELSSVGTSADCTVFGGCLVACAVWAGPGLDCVAWCADRYPAGFDVRLALNGTCTFVCGGLPPCQ